MTPLRRQSLLYRVWRVIYPCGIHFLISQIVAYSAVNYLLASGGTYEDYQSQVLMLTGVTGLLVLIPCAYLYGRTDAPAFPADCCR